MTPLETAKQVPKERWSFVGETNGGDSAFWDEVTGILCYMKYHFKMGWILPETSEDVRIPKVYLDFVKEKEALGQLKTCPIQALDLLLTAQRGACIMEYIETISA